MQADWRTPEQSRDWDLALLESVFRQVLKQHARAVSEKNRRRSTAISNNEGSGGVTTRGNRTRSITPMERTRTDEPTAEPLPTAIDWRDRRQFEHHTVTKAEVLMALQATELILRKRPFLRVLYTNLSCCSHAREMESIASYVKYRLRERTITLAIARDQLIHIYKKHMDLLAFQARLEAFQAAARTKSVWCVRDRRAIEPSPSRFYNVHVLPPRRKTQQQLDQDRQRLHAYAVEVTTTVIQSVVTQMVNTCRPTSRQRSAKSGGRHRGETSHNKEPVTTPNRLLRAQSSAALAARAKMKRDQEELEVRRQELRLRICVPGIQQTQQQTAKMFSMTTLGMNTPPSEKEKELVRSPTVKGTEQQELLALAEANGDLRIAHQLLQHTIARSGFNRVSEHMANLGTETPTAWAVLKLWKTVYRSHSIQSVQRLEQS